MIELPHSVIDPASPVPLYFQLAEILEREITSGHWEPGSRLPSEPDIGRHYSVSRTTIRQALARLEQRGLIRRRTGVGTFVQSAQPGLWLLQSTEGFFQTEVDRLGRSVTSRILRAERGRLPNWACTALGVPLGSTGGTLERLRSIDGLVTLYVVNYLPERLAEAALAFTNQDESLYRRLQKLEGIEVVGGRRFVEAVPAEGRIAGLLEVETGTPLALIESASWGRDLRPFDCYRVWLRTDRMRIDIQVGSSLPAAEPLAVSTVEQLG